MNRLSVFIGTILLSCQTLTAQQGNADNQLAKKDIKWIERVLDNLDSVCRKELKIQTNPLPWIIFYDSTSAWHLNPDKKMLPASEKTNYQFIFDGKKYELIRIAQTKIVWVPDRDPIPMGTLPFVTMPYANNQTSFFISPLPSLFHLLAPASEAVYLDFLFLGMNMHELIHTRQLPFTLSKILQIQRDYKLPANLDDNTIENSFGKIVAYKEYFLAEKDHFWKAALAENKDSCIAHIKQAFKIVE